MSVRILQGDVMQCLDLLPDESVHCVVTSPPYWGLRDYDVAGQLGLEKSLGEHIDVLLEVFREVRRVLRKDGTLWLNYGDCYASVPNGRSAAKVKELGKDDRTFRDKPFSTVGPIYDPEYENGDRRGVSGNKGIGDGSRGRILADGFLKPGNLCLIPERLAIALQLDGWVVRSRIIWGKKNTKPDSSGRFRPSYNHEMIWMLSKQSKCFYDSVAVRQPTASSSKARLSQNVEQQTGSFRQPGKTNGAFKAVGDKDTRLLRAYEPETTDVWEMATARTKEAHFATFPPELVHRCISSGTSEHGVCSECGAPYLRLTEKEFNARPDVSLEKGVRGHSGQKPMDRTSGLTGTQRGTTAVATVGWSASCSCNAQVAPATVLDPFFGSGTTGMVAKSLRRNCIGIELNPAYVEIAKRRCA
jgi:DNA modification methylase